MSVFLGGRNYRRNRYDGCYYPEISSALFHFSDHAIIDGAVVVVGMYVFGIHKALYAIIAVYLVTKVSDGLIEGLKFSKAVYITQKSRRKLPE